MGRNNITPRNNSKKKRVPNIVTSLFFLMLPPGQAGTINPCMRRRVYLQLTTSCWQSNFLHTMKIMLKRFGYEEWTCWIQLIDCYFEVANKCLGLNCTRPQTWLTKYEKETFLKCVICVNVTKRHNVINPIRPGI